MRPSLTCLFIKPLKKKASLNCFIGINVIGFYLIKFTVFARDFQHPGLFSLVGGRGLVFEILLCEWVCSNPPHPGELGVSGICGGRGWAALHVPAI